MTFAAGLVLASSSFMVSGLLGLLLLPVLKRHAMDVPNVRSSHNTPTPRGGGIAVVLAIVGPVVIVDLGEGVAATLLGVGTLALLGLVDDLIGLNEIIRFGVQVLVSLTVSYLLVVDWVDGWMLVVALTVVAALWLTAFTNAFNFMDGINGISAVTACLAAGWYLWLGHALELPAVGLLSASLLGAAAGFLPFNFPRAHLFLGDVGSYGIGILLACLAMLTMAGGAAPLASLAPLMLYVADTGWTLARRMHRREKWWKAHRENVYQRLTASGVHPIAVTCIVGALTLVVCLFAAVDVNAGVGLAAALAVMIGYLASPNLILLRRR